MTYHAKNTRATLTIFIPYPPDLQAKLDAASDTVAAIVASIPDYARPRVHPFMEFHPAIKAWENTIDLAPIRAEFDRKAKKLGLSAPHDVEWKNMLTGIMCEVTAK